MQDIDYILDFVVHLGREMLECGANLERVNMSIEIICKSYNLREVSIFSLNNSISVSARNIGEPAKVRQVAVPINGIHLERLRRLNNLSYQVCHEKPKPQELEDMLFEALMVPGYSTKILILGYIIAMTCLCRLFGGGLRDIIVADLSTVIIFFLSNYLAGKKLNRIITNVISMFIAEIIALLFIYIGFAQNIYAIVITNAFYLIPGIPMVNSVRNILCGNEMNGILELLKVTLEVLTIAAGLFIAYFLFGQWYTDNWETDLLTNVEIVILSFWASLGFGLVFQIRRKDLVYAALGGMLTRIVYLLLMAFIPYRIVYAALAAFFAAVYAEILAYHKKTPATLFLYPSIIPLIPGDLFYYTMGGIIMGDGELFATNAVECILALVGISIGFVLSSSVSHYVRRLRIARNA